MIDRTGRWRGLRRAGALAVAAAVAVLATACGGGGDPSSASTPTYVQVLALAQCMRGHGVPNFPDPQASGGYALTSNGSLEGAGGSSIDINSSQAQAAYGDCRHLLPGGPSISQLEQIEQQEQQEHEQALPAVLKWEQCVRSHGVPNFPDVKSGAFDPNSPLVQAALSGCQHLLPPGAHVSVNRNASAS